ncbi:MAG TPA: hypothetical protein VI381_05595 [Allosphingosinicella sp.]
MSSRYKTIARLALASLAAQSSPALAENVTLSGTLLNSCLLSLSVPGVLAPSSDGTVLSSENSGGVAATLALVAIGGAPTVTFAAPSPAGPIASTSGATTQIRYTSLQGASQSYTSSASSRVGGALIDTFTVHGRIANSNGFAAGNYSVTTVVTCQQ